MELVVMVAPSDGTNPGHMIIGQESAAGDGKFFGYRFDPIDLPAEYQTADRWQEYLFSNKILGEIRDETDHARRVRLNTVATYYEKRTFCDVSIETQIPPTATWRRIAYYSFSPDDFHSEASPCYNCATWATMVGNNLVPGFLTPVRQGRIKLIIQQIQLGASQAGETDG